MQHRIAGLSSALLYQGDAEVHSPVVHDGAGVSYTFIQHNNVFLLTAARQNCNAASILLFLHRLVDVRAPPFSPQRAVLLFSIASK